MILNNNNNTCNAHRYTTVTHRYIVDFKIKIAISIFNIKYLSLCFPMLHALSTAPRVPPGAVQPRQKFAENSFARPPNFISATPHRVAGRRASGGGGSFLRKPPPLHALPRCLRTLPTAQSSAFLSALERRLTNQAHSPPKLPRFPRLAMS